MNLSMDSIEVNGKQSEYTVCSQSMGYSYTVNVTEHGSRAFIGWLATAVCGMLHGDWLIHSCVVSNDQSYSRRCGARTLHQFTVYTVCCRSWPLLTTDNFINIKQQIIAPRQRLSNWLSNSPQFRYLDSSWVSCVCYWTTATLSGAYSPDINSALCLSPR